MKRMGLWLAMALLTFGSVHAQTTPCLLTPAELESATSRAFAAGVPGKDATGMKGQCIYAEQSKPQRRVIVSISRTNAKAQFDASKRLLQSSKEPVDIAGVGEAAYFNGVAAGVLTNDAVITLHGLRRASDPKIDSEKVAKLLERAVSRLR